MALYVVERDLSNVAPEQLRLDQRSVASACVHLKAQGKSIRYISSSVVPADGRGLDLFGAATGELVEEVHLTARVSFSRIVEILDLTPRFLYQEMSRARRSRQRASNDTGRTKGLNQTMTSNSTEDLTRWLVEGQRFFGICLDMVSSSDRLEARNQALESENAMLREEVARFRHRVDMLQNERSDMVAAFNDLAGHVTQVVDHILQKSEDGENSTETGL
jgi:hypothetical protein